ncbi:leucine-rich receptor-like protein kinase family protein [Striga asiatica]|uniref:Leucine-rich receptor-like protein kinase family protein n=1 Tax=Striga asiatica TaxID=4170 RepID=A0A5A7QDN5_STRAF|nr:leucine-rich receptor-like protein kinase family protein [Striga asiatica]
MQIKLLFFRHTYKMMNTILMIFMATMWLLITLPPQGAYGIKINEGDVLLTLKNNLTDPNKALESWGTTGNPCDGKWANIACDHYNYVFAIVLNGLGLSGELVPELSKLKRLSTL